MLPFTCEKVVFSGWIKLCTKQLSRKPISAASESDGMSRFALFLRGEEYSRIWQDAFTTSKTMRTRQTQPSQPSRPFPIFIAERSMSWRQPLIATSQFLEAMSSALYIAPGHLYVLYSKFTMLWLDLSSY